MGKINQHLLFAQQSELEIDTRTFIDVPSTERSKLNRIQASTTTACHAYPMARAYLRPVANS